MKTNYYQATELPLHHCVNPSNDVRRPSWLLVCAVAVVVACVTAFITYDVTSQHFIASSIQRVQSRVGPLYATTRTQFPFGRKEVPPPPPPPKSSGLEALESVGRVTGVGAKVVSELALYLAFNTAYFITNTYQFLTKDEQQKLARETVDKQLPELLSLLGGTTEALGKTASTVAASEEYKDLQKTAAQAAEELKKGIKTESTPAPEVIEKLKSIVADEKGEVLSEERKSALAETLKKGGVKGAELSLYLFYNVFSVLRNLDKVLPTPDQTGGIEGKIQQLETKVVELGETVKELPSAGPKLAAKVAEIKETLPTADDLANLDPAEVSLSVRSSLASAKTGLDKAVVAVNEALKEDSDFRKSLQETSIKLKPVTDGVGALVAKLPLPKNADGSIDYSRLLAETGIITVKGIKALIEATKKAVASISAKTSDN